MLLRMALWEAPGNPGYQVKIEVGATAGFVAQDKANQVGTILQRQKANNRNGLR